MSNPDFNINNSLNESNMNNKRTNYNSKINSDEEENKSDNSNRYINKKPKGNFSPDQYNLLQGLTNPEQFDKFMKISNILDRQNDEQINLTNNLFLRRPPVRDFDPKEWGCKNCPCNIHGNPNVSCNCCSCNICPNKIKENNKNEKIKQRVFPINPNFSYSYSYEM